MNVVVPRDSAETMPRAVVVLDAEGRVSFANPMAGALLGVAGEALERGSFLPPGTHLVDDKAAWVPLEKHPWEVARRTHQSMCGVRVGIADADEAVRQWIRVHAIPVRRFDAHASNAVCVVFAGCPGPGVVGTEPKQDDLGTRSVFDSAQQLVGVLAPDGTVLDLNKRALEFSPSQAADLVGRPFWETKWWAHSEALRCQARAAVEGAAAGEVVCFEAMLWGADGRPHWLDFSVSPVRGENGDVLLLVPEAHDVTPEKRAAEMLRIQRDLAVSLNAAADLSCALDMILTSALQIEGIDCGGVYVTDPSTGDLNLAAQVGLGADLKAAVCCFPSASPEAKLVMEGRPVFGRYPEILGRDGADPIRDRQTLRSLAIVPALHADQVVGCLNLASYGFEEIPLQSRTAIETLAALVGSVIARLQNERALQLSEEKYRKVVEHANEAILVAQNGMLKVVNRRAIEMFGYSAEELTSRPFTDFIHPDDRALVLGRHWRRIAGEQVQDIYPFRFVRPDGTVGWAELRAAPIVWAGRPATLSLSSEITDRRLSEERLRDSETRYRAVFENTGTASVIISDDRTIVLANTEFANLTGYSKQEIEGKMRWNEFVVPEDLPRMMEQHDLRRTNRNGALKRYEFRLPDRHGSIKDVFLTIDMIPETTDSVASLMDITERRRGEDALRALTASLQEAERIAHLGSWSIDLATRSLRWSDEAARIFGFDPKEPPPSWDAIALRLGLEQRDRDLDQFVDHQCQQPEVELDLQLSIPNQSPRWLHIMLRPRRRPNGAVDALFAVVQDVTDSRRAEADHAKLEEQLRQAIKMEAIGRLAGGIAHDFNNILTGISGYTQVILGSLGAGDPLRDDLIEIKRGVSRAAELTRQLLGFSRRQIVSPMTIDINLVIEQSRRMLTRIIGEDVVLRFIPSPTAVTVHLDPGQLEQILVNLAVNSRDAMPNGGTLTIETSNVKIGEEFVRHNVDARVGEWALIVITDTGVGMDSETLAHLFEPFFTTKPKGQSTGLGLATVYGIVKQNEGFASVHSEPGQGSIFELYLPRSDADPCSEPMSRRCPAPRRGGQETILVVEDEGLVRNLAKRVLELHGYHVLVAENGGEALVQAESFAGRIDLLLTDVIMPLMNGRQLHGRLSASRPDMKVIFMSGYPADVIAPHGVLEPGLCLVSKPFTIDSLLAKVREILDSE